MAQFPSKEIAQLSYDLPATLGLGFANIGGLLMAAGISYDSREGRAIAGAISAVMTGVSYATSAEMAGELGTVPGICQEQGCDAARDAQPSPRRAWRGRRAMRGLSTLPVPLDLAAVLTRTWPSRRSAPGTTRFLSAKASAIRNAQSTVIAPTGTIGLVMDCDTTGVEPDFALVKFKKLAGGGYFKIINRCVPEALATLQYTQGQIDAIVAYAVGPRHAGRFFRRAEPRRAARQGLRRTSRSKRSKARWNRRSTSASCSTSGTWAPASAPTCWASTPRRSSSRTST